MSNLNMNNTILRLVRDVNNIQSSLRRVVGNLPLFDIANENTPAVLTTDQNNYAPGNFDVLRLNATSDVSISGFRGGLKGRFLRIFNVGTGEISILHQSVLSDAENRVVTPTDFAVVIAQNEELVLYYDSSQSRWITSYSSSANRISCQLQITTDQTIPHATYTTVRWDDVIEDTGGFFDAGNPEVIMYPETGWYYTSALLIWDTNSTGLRELSIRESKDAPPRTSFVWDSRLAVAGAQTIVPISVTNYKIKGEIVEVLVWHNAVDGGGNPVSLDVLSARGIPPFLYTKAVVVKL